MPKRRRNVTRKRKMAGGLFGFFEKKAPAPTVQGCTLSMWERLTNPNKCKATQMPSSAQGVPPAPSIGSTPATPPPPSPPFSATTASGPPGYVSFDSLPRPTPPTIPPPSLQSFEATYPDFPGFLAFLQNTLRKASPTEYATYYQQQITPAFFLQKAPKGYSFSDVPRKNINFDKRPFYHTMLEIYQKLPRVDPSAEKSQGMFAYFTRSATTPDDRYTEYGYSIYLNRLIYFYQIYMNEQQLQGFQNTAGVILLLAGGHYDSPPQVASLPEPLENIFVCNETPFGFPAKVSSDDGEHVVMNGNVAEKMYHSIANYHFVPYDEISSPPSIPNKGASVKVLPGDAMKNYISPNMHGYINKKYVAKPNRCYILDVEKVKQILNQQENASTWNEKERMRFAQEQSIRDKKEADVLAKEREYNEMQQQQQPKTGEEQATASATTEKTSEVVGGDGMEEQINLLIQALQSNDQSLFAQFQEANLLYDPAFRKQVTKQGSLVVSMADVVNYYNQLGTKKNLFVYDMSSAKVKDPMVKQMMSDPTTFQNPSKLRQATKRLSNVYQTQLVPYGFGGTTTRKSKRQARRIHKRTCRHKYRTTSRSRRKQHN